MTPIPPTVTPTNTAIPSPPDYLAGVSVSNSTPVVGESVSITFDFTNIGVYYDEYVAFVSRLAAPSLANLTVSCLNPGVDTCELQQLADPFWQIVLDFNDGYQPGQTTVVTVTGDVVSTVQTAVEASTNGGEFDSDSSNNSAAAYIDPVAPTATTTPTETATATATDIPPTATDVPPTETATSTDIPPAATGTATDIPPTTPAETGNVVVTIGTANGSPIPDNTEVCIGDQCQLLDAIAAAAVPSGTSATFNDLAPGSYPVSVSIEGTEVYADTVTVVAGETINVSVILPTGAATPSPVDPGEGPVDGPPPVNSLPSTGAGSDPPWAAYLVLLGGAALVSLAGALTWRQRRNS